MNSLIELILKNFTVNDTKIPVSFLRYNGKKETYITYQQTDIDETLYGDDTLIYYKDYYDFDIYSKGNYLPIITELKDKLQSNGFMWEPTRSSGDLFEVDTGYYHKTLCFSINREE